MKDEVTRAREAAQWQKARDVVRGVVKDPNLADLTVTVASLITILLANHTIEFDQFRVLIGHPEWEPRDFIESMREHATPDQLALWEKWADAEEAKRKLFDGPLGSFLKGMI